MNNKELDRYIADHVMGWDTKAMVKQSDGLYFLVGPVPGNKHLVKYSPTTDAAAAIEVLEKCLKKTTHIEIDFEDGVYHIMEAHEPTLPLAICRYAQKIFSENQTPARTETAPQTSAASSG